MLNDFLYRLRALFRRKTVERELEEEVEFHLEHQVEKSMRAGLTRAEALREARMKLGGPEQVKEECRQARGVSLVETILQDARYAVRMLAKSPGFTTAVALSLALGIGANTAIFSLIDAVMWRMLPVAEPEGLAMVAQARSGSADRFYGFRYKDYRLLREFNQAFTDMAAYSTVRIQASVNGSLEPTTDAQLVTGAYFSLLGVRPAVGRAIGPEDDVAPDGHPVAMLSYGFWKRRFGRDPGIVGQTITLAGRAFTIIGVAPPQFFGLEVGASPDIFAPAMMQPTLMPASENFLTNPILNAGWLRVFGRLKPGVNTSQAEAAMDALWRQEQLNEPGKDGPRKPQDLLRLVLAPAATGLSGLRAQFSQPLFLLRIVVGVVLLIACANTASLLLARAAARRPEFGMRRALGAGRGRLIRQMLVESVALAAFGGVGGLLLARWATKLLVAFMSIGRNPIVLHLEPDWRMLAFTAAASVLTGILFGLAPAIHAARIDGVNSLSARTSGRGALRPGKILTVVQLSLSLVLLIAAGLFVRTVRELSGQDAGFDRDSVLVLRVEPKGSDQRNIPGTSVRLDRTYQDLIQRIQAIPGVRAASMAQFEPTRGVGFSSPLKLESGKDMRIARMMTYPNYFSAMGIPLLAGRDLNAGDLGEKSPMVVVVNEAFAKQAFPGENPVGKQFFQRDRPTEIIGLAKNSRYASLRGETPPLMYQPFFQTDTGRGQMVLHVRVAGNAGLVSQRVRQEVYRIDNNLPMFNLHTLATEVDAALIQEGMIATLSSFFSVLALSLACVGLYGLLSFGVVRRTAEMGIRMALGATRRVVVWMVLREALLLVAIGIAISVPASIAIARLAGSRISGMLFGLTATDPATIAGAAAVLAAVALVAAYLPARRAARVDPMRALRNE